MKELTLTQKEQARLQVLNDVLDGGISVDQAAELLGVSSRHTWRMLAAYRKNGATALSHGNRGRRPANARSTALSQHLVSLATGRYAGVNHTHLTELLAEREGLKVSRSSVRRILARAGISSPRSRRPPRHRCRRERMPREGALLQLDGSHHDWLEGRGPRFCLLLAVDDATGTVPYAIFLEQETALGYFLLLRAVVERKGIPLAVYSDRHAVFRAAIGEQSSGDNERAGGRAETQVGRALGELGIQSILARSPQAKGRVERCAGTFQDRLVSQLRLAAADSLEAANEVLWEYLPAFNARFGVEAAEPELAYRAVGDMDLDDILCFKHCRKVARDNTVRFEREVLQVVPDASRRTYARATVEVQKRIDGDLAVAFEGRRLTTRTTPSRQSAKHSRNGAGSHRDSRRLAHAVNSTETKDRRRMVTPRDADVASVIQLVEERSASLPKPPETPQERRRRKRRRPLQPTPRQQARWNAVHEAKGRGLSISAIAREVGITRFTVRKYLAAASPPINRRPPTGDGHSTATDTIAEP